MLTPNLLGDTRTQKAHMHGGWVAYRTDMTVLGAEWRKGISVRRQVICRHSDGAHLGSGPVWTGA